MIRAIQSETNTKIEIEDSGIVKIAAASAEEGEAEVVVGEVAPRVAVDPRSVEVAGVFDEQPMPESLTTRSGGIDNSQKA